MHIARLLFQNFRNFQSLDLHLDQGFVVLTGPNGAGKTNFLEGIYFGSTLRKFPESKFGQLFLEGRNFLRAKIELENREPVVQEVYAEYRETRPIYKLKVNGQETPRSKYAGILPIVSFVPQDLNILTRSPSNRRRFLSETLSLGTRQYRYAQQQYEKSLRQRNELWQKISGQGRERIDDEKLGLPEMDIWDEKLAEFGSLICQHRDNLLKYLNASLPAIIASLSPELTEVKFVYRMSGAVNKQEFLEKLRSLRQTERQRGTTLLGPHRDDFATLLQGKDVVGFVSRGQMRSLTLALKFTEKQYLEEQTGESPIMLLDDIFSEFDFEHQKKLTGFLSILKQVFLTTIHLEEVQDFLPKRAQVYAVNQGAVTSTAINV